MWLVLLSTSQTEPSQTGPMGSTRFDLKIFKSRSGSVWLDLSSWWGQTDGVDGVDRQVDGTDEKLMGLILMTPSVRLGGPSQSVWFDFDFKSDQTGPLTTLGLSTTRLYDLFFVQISQNAQNNSQNA